jgi:hypothetical protein
MHHFRIVNRIMNSRTAPWEDATRFAVRPPTMPRLSLGSGASRSYRRSSGSVLQFAGGADYSFRFKLDQRLVVLVVAPIDVAVLVDGSRWPVELA